MLIKIKTSIFKYYTKITLRNMFNYNYEQNEHLSN